MSQIEDFNIEEWMFALTLVVFFKHNKTEQPVYKHIVVNMKYF